MRHFISRLFRRLNKTQAPADLAHLTSLVRRYTIEQQQVPKDLVELVALNYLPALPAPPPGHRFVIDRTRVEVRLQQQLTAARSCAP